MASFGYRDQEITPKVRWNKEAIYEVIEQFKNKYIKQ